MCVLTHGRSCLAIGGMTWNKSCEDHRTQSSPKYIAYRFKQKRVPSKVCASNSGQLSANSFFLRKSIVLQRLHRWCYTSIYNYNVIICLIFVTFFHLYNFASIMRMKQSYPKLNYGLYCLMCLRCIV